MAALCVEGDKNFIGEVISIFLLLFWKETYNNIYFLLLNITPVLPDSHVNEIFFIIKQ